MLKAFHFFRFVVQATRVKISPPKKTVLSKNKVFYSMDLKSLITIHLQKLLLSLHVDLPWKDLLFRGVIFMS